MTQKVKNPELVYGDTDWRATMGGSTYLHFEQGVKPENFYTLDDVESMLKVAQIKLASATENKARIEKDQERMDHAEYQEPDSIRARTRAERDFYKAQAAVENFERVVGQLLAGRGSIGDVRSIAFVNSTVLESGQGYFDHDVVELSPFALKKDSSFTDAAGTLLSDERIIEMAQKARAQGGTKIEKPKKDMSDDAGMER